MVMDLFSRAIVGWVMDKQMTTDLICRVLLMGLGHRKIRHGLIVHSDRGVQYAANQYQSPLEDHDIVCIMSRKGNCYDNAAMESFFHSLKTEWTDHRVYQTREQGKSSIFEYIEVFYNTKRRHFYVHQVSPLQFKNYMRMRFN